MRWYVWLYIASLVMLGLASCLDQLEEGRGFGAVVIDALSTAVLVYFVIAYFNADAALPRLWNIILAAFAIAWSVYDGVRELRTVIAQRPASYNPGLSPRANLRVDRVVEVFAGSAGVLVVLPAFTCAFAVIFTR